ncbi:sodium/proton antiporter (CPA1 family) [Glaciihabitans tibetensis]|uniref:Sodium/proton antiporter (CPA1 family) n=1 Tax=Glaciihabitans tibetensis TaxID=1266600 RepID=A0A2T0VAD1_9MICO|nr:Na+/H+ antiporter [Glaciihabitans tibetensis]PRY67142.1 sodium/proton antiporter (CPA1 family) [Glaciihabitans tibetensis]
MEALAVVVLVGAIIVIGAVAAPRLHVPTPLLLLLLGIAVGFVPQEREVQLPSEAVLVLFLPALLFWESLTTSLREIRRDLRGILLLSTLLVVATAFGVAGIATALGLTWGAALILGAALAPTDATAVGAIAKSLPHRNMTVLRAESLMNDGTALVIFSIAVGIGVSQIDYSGWQITGLVALAYLGGGLIGALAGWGGTLILARIREPIANNALLVVIPFAAFLVAELISASGVIAVVVAGLALSQSGPRVGTPQARQQSLAFWSLATFFLNSALFVLVGIEVHVAVNAVEGDAFGPLLLLTLFAWIAVLVIRFGFQMASVFLIRLLDRRPSQRGRRMSHRARVVSTVSGFRGAVSLAVALAVPTVLASGEPFPGRDEIVFVTTGVVLLTLIVQGLLLPLVIRWAHFEPDTAFDDELAGAELAATTAALEHLTEEAARLGTDAGVRDRVAAQFEEHRALLDASPGVEEDELLRAQDRQAMELRLALLERKRAVMIELRDGGTINDTTLRTMQTRLDREALRLTQPEILE